MPRVSANQLRGLQAEPSNIRNFCIVAHVDHGKTTLSDSLIAANSIISSRMAGELRYLDSRSDEQQRGITMKSSVISLMHTVENAKTKEPENFLLNLLDSPGHVDFAGEVSTAVRLSDGALVVVDVVEGMCPQTYTVLRHIFLEQCRPVLVLNKMDRLIMELKLSPEEAFSHLQLIIQVVNAAIANLLSADLYAKAGSDASFIDQTQANSYFSPEYGNVLFGSASDGWGFNVDTFAQIWTAKLQTPRATLRKTLWGDFYYDVKNAKVAKGALNKGKKPLFVQFVLEPLWEVYESVYAKHTERINKIVKSMKLKISPRDSRSQPRVYLQAILKQWIPVHKSILDMVVRRMPSPKAMNTERAKMLLYGNKPLSSFPDTEKLLSVLQNCSAEEPLVAFVSKLEKFEREMTNQQQQVIIDPALRQADHEAAKQRARDKYKDFTNDVGSHNDGFNGDLRNELKEVKFDEHELASLELKMDDMSIVGVNDHQQQQEQHQVTDTNGAANEIQEKEAEQEEEEKETSCLIAFTRIYSGKLSVGQEVYVLGPKYHPNNPTKYVTKEVIKELYIVMGKDLEPVESVIGGNIIGIVGLNSVLKSATLTTSLNCPSMCAMHLEAAPIVTVALEPTKLGQMSKLIECLTLLHQSDSVASFVHSDRGELLLSAAGEVHLEQCIKDITEVMGTIKRSAPIVPFRETIVLPPKMDMAGEAIVENAQGDNNTNNSNNNSNNHNNSNNNNNNNNNTNSEGDENNNNDNKNESSETIKTSFAEISNQSILLKISVTPLPQEIIKVIGDRLETLQALTKLHGHDDKDYGLLNEKEKELETEFREKLQSCFKEDEDQKWSEDIVDKILAFGPNNTGPNILLNGTDYSTSLAIPDLNKTYEVNTEYESLFSSIKSGFQIASGYGPMCEEPMRGVCFTIDKFEYRPTETISRSAITGQLINITKDLCRKAVLNSYPRLMAAMYSCEIQAHADVLGKVYGVVTKRKGQIYSEEMKEGTPIFIVKSYLPVINSFGFVDEIRKRASGSANPQLIFDHWQVIDEDPYWIPSTEEELQHFGAKADYENIARKYMDDVRKRKGLIVVEKMVEFAEKQRTLGRNK